MKGHRRCCQSVVFMSDPQQGAYASMVIGAVSVSIRAIQKENQELGQRLLLVN